MSNGVNSIASNIENEEKSKIVQAKAKRNNVLSWIVVIVLAFIAALSINQFFKTADVVGLSMYPTFNNGDYLIVNRVDYFNASPKYKDVVVFNTDLDGGKALIKRVIATPGQHLVIKNNQVIVNGSILSEPYIHGEETDGNIDVVVPANSYFVMGDNRENSHDSRFGDIGFIDKSQIIGKVAVRVFPFNSFKLF